MPYVQGRPCIDCGVIRSHNGARPRCMACHRKRWCVSAEERERRHRARSAQYRADHLEEVREKQRAYSRTEEARANARAYRQAHREERNARRRQHVAELRALGLRPEPRAPRRSQLEKPPCEICGQPVGYKRRRYCSDACERKAWEATRRRTYDPAKRRAEYERNKDHTKEQHARYRQEHLDAVRQRAREWARTRYARDPLISIGGERVRLSEVPPELQEVTLLIKRARKVITQAGGSRGR